MAESEPELGAVMIVGGAGFIGCHVTKCFRERANCSSIAVLSREPFKDTISGVSYHTGDLLRPESLRETIMQISPEIIIHAACPPSTSSNIKTHHATIVEGTRSLLAIAQAVPSVKIFIYTSSAPIAAGKTHVNLDETAPSIRHDDIWAHPYERCKAIADKMVTDANNPDATNEGESTLLTGCLRLPLVYGERDSLSIPGCLRALEKNQTGVVFGDGENQWSFLSVENAAHAHLLLAVAMSECLTRGIDPSQPKVDGEAFNITDGETHKFWDYPHLIWRAAGWRPPTGYKPIRLAPGLLHVIASIFELFYYVFTLGRMVPTTFTRQEITFASFEHTYNIDKARQRLGYSPSATFEKDVDRAVQWCLTNHGWAARLEKRMSQNRKQKQ